MESDSLDEKTQHWETILEGCPEEVIRSFVDALVAQGLDPEDSASLVELSPQLLDALHLDDQVARERVLALACSAAEQMSAKSGTSPIALGGHAMSRGNLCVRMSPDERRVFEQTDQRGGQAQEIVPGVFLGGFRAATNVDEQRKFQITHIVNATSRPLRNVDTKVTKVMCLNLNDADGEQDISCHFWPVIEFIEEALAAGCAALVHCVRGVSRSSTLVCAYIIAKTGCSVQEALAIVREARPVAKPRQGFLHQLNSFKRQLESGSRGRLGHTVTAELASSRAVGSNDPGGNISRRWKTTKSIAKH